ncbi:YhcB family protein [Pseudohongiella sp.]|uniref:DUF1043 family protein n=1 Tax=marine sediment metagenome TaxID=412755 RepID=A0A0F9VMV2_9ZZZZ|nr:DUF1043 family protein [Pseudohongiella sp.]HDZ10440.1 DUF1043 family protein [Pseudohongiella sp.]HEA62223.1 DUF1043 family protein [Pseudohongiella sp.]
MLWLTGIVCLAVGLVAGVLIAKRFNGSNSAKVSELETRVQELQRHHAQYRDDVSTHFNTTAELVQQMTESYRDVYQHLAGGAQDLCTDDVASKLLPATEQSMFYHADDNALEPPKDYAPKKIPGQSGALAENFGLDIDTGPGQAKTPYQSKDSSQGPASDAKPDGSPDNAAKESREKAKDHRQTVDES